MNLQTTKNKIKNFKISGTPLFDILKVGALASLIMIPFGLILTAIGFKTGIYGELVLSYILGFSKPGLMFLFHIIIGAVSAIPFMILFNKFKSSFTGKYNHYIIGLLYGFVYYIIINGTILPIIFGNPITYLTGLSLVIPSLIVHLVYGLGLGFFAKRFYK
jgi:hypothetical protein